jgi:hypothetical protein
MDLWVRKRTIIVELTEGITLTEIEMAGGIIKITEIRNTREEIMKTCTTETVVDPNFLNLQSISHPS